jgi:HSP20 family protein
MKSVILRNNYSPMRSLFEDFLNEDFFSLGKSNVPSVNVKEEESEFQIEVAAPGYKKDSFNIEVKDNYLTISSKNESTKEDKSDKYHRREFFSSSFERSFYLPEGSNAENIKASYTDGILSVSVPKKTKVEKESRMIEIQ